MPVSNRLKNQHLLWRVAFGPMAENADSLETITPKNLWALLLKTSDKVPDKIDVAKNFVADYLKDVTNMADLQKRELTKEQK